ncbi:MAG: D-isomer specific 2-hydroxyacid dehydrogenase family protein [Coriobacteriaceae bacterium]|nr:D-isomer specific 2-hydroxyacid dehydrogenase family protein [Coriobacteriaceae bacterium]
MKIKVYELREDERAACDRVAGTLPADCTVTTSTECLTEATLDTLDGAEGVVIVNKSPLNASMLQKLSERGVRFVATRSIGYNHIDVEAAKRLGIHVCNTTYPPYGVAEFAVMLMLMALRKYKPALWRQQVNDYSLAGLQGRELRTLKVGVMGTGRIGQAVIGYLKGFGCKILAYDPYPSEAVAASGDVEYVTLDELYSASDLITVHIPLMEATRGIIDAAAIAKMRDGVVLVNVSRGELMDVEALMEGIESQKIGALAMDVFAEEDGIYHVNRTHDILANRNMAYLRQFPNVILTQHIAFYTDIDVDSMVEQGLRGVVDMAAGECATEL